MPSPAALRNAGMLCAMHSRIRWRMKNAVFRLTPHLSADSRRVSTSTWHSANFIQVARSSFVVANTRLVLAVKVLEQRRHRKRCSPRPSSPRLTTWPEPHRGHSVYRAVWSPDSATAMAKNSSSIILFSDLRASALSSGSICGRNCLAIAVKMFSISTSSC